MRKILKISRTPNTLLALTVVLLSQIWPPIAAAEETPRTVEMKEEGGFSTLTIPVFSFQRKDEDVIEVVGGTAGGESSRQIRIEIGPNGSAPRKGVTHTVQACAVSFGEKIFRDFAGHLSVALPASPQKSIVNSFDMVEEEGSLSGAEGSPLKLLLIDLQDDALYSEWYLTIDLSRARIRLSEKNNEYRDPFIATFLR